MQMRTMGSRLSKPLDCEVHLPMHLLYVVLCASWLLQYKARAKPLKCWERMPLSSLKRSQHSLYYGAFSPSQLAWDREKERNGFDGSVGDIF